MKMNKKRTPLCLAIEYLFNTANHTDKNSEYYISPKYFEQTAIFLASLKPTEREMFQDFASKRFYRNPKELNTKQYFNEYLTQD